MKEDFPVFEVVLMLFGGLFIVGMILFIVERIIIHCQSVHDKLDDIKNKLKDL
jgi:hypothetical protein